MNSLHTMCCTHNAEITKKLIFRLKVLYWEKKEERRWKPLLFSFPVTDILVKIVAKRKKQHLFEYCMKGLFLKQCWVVKRGCSWISQSLCCISNWVMDILTRTGRTVLHMFPQRCFLLSWDNLSLYSFWLVLIFLLKLKNSNRHLFELCISKPQ